MDIAEKGEPYKTGMKAISIEKINFDKSTEGYFVKNYAGMSMMDMMKAESEEK